MSFFSEMLAVGLGIVRDLTGESVVYHAGNVAISIEKATPLQGRQIETIDQREALDTQELDWGIEAALLVHDGAAITPAPGHYITWSVLGKTNQYTVTPRDGDQCWNWSDEGGQTQYRIHTVLTRVT